MASAEFPGQLAPLPTGAGLLQSLVLCFTPRPQVVLHAPHAPQTPHCPLTKNKIEIFSKHYTIPIQKLRLRTTNMM